MDNYQRVQHILCLAAGFYPPAILPLLIVFTITSVETVGDVTATAETSRLPVGGEEHVKRIKGGMLNDGISGIFSALGGSLPLTTFAQVSGTGKYTVAAKLQAESRPFRLRVCGQSSMLQYSQ